MIILGNRKRLYTGCWVLALLIIGGYNGFILTSIFSPPLVGRSKETRLASQKWLRLDNKQSTIHKNSLEQFDLQQVIDRFSPDISIIKSKPIPSKSKKLTGKFEKESEAIPPVVTGIIKISDVHGNHRRFALMEGKQLMENDSIRGFTVNKITDKGVVLIYNEKKLFVPSPQVHFSLNNEQ